MVDAIAALPSLAEGTRGFTSASEAEERIRAACRTARQDVALHEIGLSEEGRPMIGVVAGDGPLHISLMAGNHADEPVGPETLRLFVEYLCRDGEALLSPGIFTFAIIPHMNPDGDVRNRAWIDQWPDLEAFARHVAREQPGRDLEFGFPDLRTENRNATAFLAHHGPVALHISLHGMAFSEGALLLINRQWAPHTERIRHSFRQAVSHHGLPVHDHNRRGEKGFFYIDAGFSTTPEGEAMRRHFEMIGNTDTAGVFRQSSMEYMHTLGGNPLCLVTELPLFLIDADASAEPGVPARYLRFKDDLAEWRLRGSNSDDLGAMAAEYNLRPLSVETAVAMQLNAIAAALRFIAERRYRFVPQIGT